MSGMPPKKYLEVADKFAAHWSSVNVALSPGTLTLAGGYGLTQFTADRSVLLTNLTSVATAITVNQGASRDRDLKRKAIKDRVRQFNTRVRGQFAGTIYLNMLPVLPDVTTAFGNYQMTLDKIASAWNRINTDVPPPAGFTQPLLLNGGYTRALFVTDSTALSVAFTSVTNATVSVKVAREARDLFWSGVYSRILQYRQAVQGSFPKGSTLIASLPKVDVSTGPTPRAVTNLLWRWDLLSSAAVITFNASTSANLDRYVLRYCPGTTWTDANSIELDTLDPTGLLEFVVSYGMPNVGNKGLFKVFVVNMDNHTKGSKVIKVTHEANPRLSLLEVTEETVELKRAA